VPTRWKRNPQLGTWVTTLRHLKTKKGKLSEERRKRLDALGFGWDRLTTKWNANFQALEAYKEEHGDCNVPKRWKKNPQLGGWVSRQRLCQAKGTLSEERWKRLDALGFDWDPDKTQWEAMFQKLKAYKEEHGDCNVPQRWKKNPKLGNWVFELRRCQAKGTLSEERKDRLDELEFNWDPAKTQWEAMFQKLVEYNKEHGDCNVTHRWKKDLQLGGWVFKQRQCQAKGTLSEERKDRLDALGFDWHPQSCHRRNPND
jgi:hypothetical protein